MRLYGGCGLGCAGKRKRKRKAKAMPYSDPTRIADDFRHPPLIVSDFRGGLAEADDKSMRAIVLQFRCDAVAYQPLAMTAEQARALAAMLMDLAEDLPTENIKPDLQ